MTQPAQLAAIAQAEADAAWDALTSPGGFHGFTATLPSQNIGAGDVGHDGLWRSVIAWPVAGADLSFDYVIVESRSRAGCRSLVVEWVTEQAKARAAR